jgi:hypothetical protein
MNAGKLAYETPAVNDYGSLVDLTAAIQVGGPVDGFGTTTPGHSSQTGPPLSGGSGVGTPPCNGKGSPPGGKTH